MSAAQHRARQSKLAGLSLATFRTPFWNGPWFRRQGYSPIPEAVEPLLREALDALGDPSRVQLLASVWIATARVGASTQ
jgi:hypothetical protein